MIFGYILETANGLLIHNKFFKIDPSVDMDLVASIFNAICSFTKTVLNEPVEEILTKGNQIVVAHSDKVMLLLISQTNTAMAKQLTKKFVKIFSNKLQTENTFVVCDELLIKIKNELADLEREITEVNEKQMHQSYV